MATMDEALCTYLMSRTQLTDLIGTGSSGRLFANVLPQDCVLSEGPAATYEIISSTEESLLAPNRSGFVQSRIQFLCFAKTHASAMAVARAIKNSGVATLKGVTNSVDFRGVQVDGIRCYTESPTDGSTEWIYVAELDLIVSYHEE